MVRTDHRMILARVAFLGILIWLGLSMTLSSLNEGISSRSKDHQCLQSTSSTTSLYGVMSWSGGFGPVVICSFSPWQRAVISGFRQEHDSLMADLLIHLCGRNYEEIKEKIIRFQSFFTVLLSPREK